MPDRHRCRLAGVQHGSIFCLEISTAGAGLCKGPGSGPDDLIHKSASFRLSGRNLLLLLAGSRFVGIPLCGHGDIGVGAIDVLKQSHKNLLSGYLADEGLCGPWNQRE